LAVSFFFWSPAALETLIKLLTQGARMSSSMYNQLARSWGGRACISGTHMSSSMYNKSFFFLDYFLLLVFGLFPFSFDLMPPLKRWVRCWVMGPACHPLCTINFLFWEFFFTPNFWLLFFFWSQAAFETLTPLLQNGTRMSSFMYNKVSFLGLFLAPDIWSLVFFFRSHAPFETLRKLLAHGSRMSYSMNNKSFLPWSYFDR
jgi:hypothetical protein